MKDVRAFRRTVRQRGDTMLGLAERFGVSRRQFYRVLNGEVSAPLVEKILGYMESAA